MFPKLVVQAVAIAAIAAVIATKIAVTGLVSSAAVSERIAVTPALAILLNPLATITPAPCTTVPVPPAAVLVAIRLALSVLSDVTG